MSIEYSTEITLPPEERQRFLDTLPNATLVLVARPSVDRILMRFSTGPRRDSWPEDFEISVGANIRLVVHSGTATERMDLVRHLESRLREMGELGQFEED
jgi:hypothetical protein